jgi:signal transduction histidine kinase
LLLFLARADAEARLPGLTSIDLAEWLPEHLQSWSGHPRAADMRLECLAVQGFHIEAHSALLGQLVDNLLDNACKYSEPGTAITILLGKESGIIRLAIEDQGYGIAAEDLPQVFEPFYRSTEARQRVQNGTGLGLAVAQRIAVVLGGTLSAESQGKSGSRFLLRMPHSHLSPMGTTEPVGSVQESQ